VSNLIVLILLILFIFMALPKIMGGEEKKPGGRELGRRDVVCCKRVLFALPMHEMLCTCGYWRRKKAVWDRGERERIDKTNRNNCT